MIYEIDLFILALIELALIPVAFVIAYRFTKLKNAVFALAGYAGLIYVVLALIIDQLFGEGIDQFMLMTILQLFMLGFATSLILGLIVIAIGKLKEKSHDKK